MATYARWNPRLLRLFESSERYFKWGLFDREPLASWTKGRVTLLGDSAHACCRSWRKALRWGSRRLRPRRIDGAPADDLDLALRHYEAMRVPRTRRAVLGSRERAKLNHLPSRWARFKRDSNTPPASCSMPTARRTASPGYTATMSTAEEQYRRTRNGCSEPAAA